MDPLHKKAGYAGLYVLFALYKYGRLHGYEAQKAVPTLTAGGVELSMASVYATLGRLLELGLVEMVADGDPSPSAKGPPRKIYQLTGEGRRIVVADLERTSVMLRELRSPAPSRQGANA